MPETRTQRLIRYLNDACAAERGGLVALRHIAAELTEPDVRAAIEDHITVTESQAKRLENRITALGGDKSPQKSAVNSMIAKSSQVANIFHDKEDKKTQDIIKAYSLEHFEIGMYTSLHAFAQAIGDTETARLADTIRGEEQQTADRLMRLIPDLATEPVGKLRSGPATMTGSPGLMSRLKVPLLVVSGVGLGLWGLSKLAGSDHNSDSNGMGGGTSGTSGTSGTTSYGGDYGSGMRTNDLSTPAPAPTTVATTTTYVPIDSVDPIDRVGTVDPIDPISETPQNPRL